MIFQDKNLTLVPPVDLTLVKVSAEGAYLRLEYIQPVSTARADGGFSVKQVVIYLTDQGREVGRVISESVTSSRDPLVVEDWSGTHQTHVKASNKFWAIVRSLYLRIIYHVRS